MVVPRPAIGQLQQTVCSSGACSTKCDLLCMPYPRCLASSSWLPPFWVEDSMDDCLAAVANVLIAIGNHQAEKGKTLIIMRLYFLFVCFPCGASSSCKLIFFPQVGGTNSPEMPRNPEKSREIPRNPEKSREIPRNPEKGIIFQDDRWCFGGMRRDEAR